MSTTATMTAESFLALREPERDRPWALVDGEVVVNPAGIEHQIAANRVLVALTLWTRGGERRGLAGSEIATQLDDRNVYIPDVWWYADGRVPAAGTPIPYAMPDLVVEVRSPSTWRYDIGAKRAGYERHDLRELWLVDLESYRVLVHRRATPEAERFDKTLELGEGEKLTSPMLPGFALPVAEIFAPH